jgi:uroporphyrinogen III methyltransferase/synthase
MAGQDRFLNKWSGSVVDRALALAGKRVVVTRTQEQSEELCLALREAGAIPILMPLISFAPPADCEPFDAALRALGEFEWILFTSQNAVRAVEERCRAVGLDSCGSVRTLRIGAVGPATAEAMKKFGLRAAHVASSHSGVTLAEELGEQLRDRKVLLPRSDRANPDLPAALRRLGANVSEVIAYRTLPAGVGQDAKRKMVESGEADAILFFSPSAVEHMAEIYGRERLLEMRELTVFGAIGPVTAAALHDIGIERVPVARDTTVSGILDCLVEYWQAGTHVGAKRR